MQKPNIICLDDQREVLAVLEKEMEFFGELFTLLEDSKREGQDEELSINLPYSKDTKGYPKKLTIPNNLYILATWTLVVQEMHLYTLKAMPK